MSVNKKVAREYIKKYEEKQDKDKTLKKDSDFIRDYINASNASTGSKYDSNANVENKNVVTLGQELHKGKNIQHNLNEKMQSDKTVNSFKEHLVLATVTLKEYPHGKFIAYAIVIKSGKTVYIFEDGFDKEFSALSAIALLRWKILEQYSEDSAFNKFNFGAITGNFDRKNNPEFGLNLARTSLNAVCTEYIGEFGIMTNKAMYNLYQASVLDRHVFKI